jgi:H+/Cl- antiporter ClcA
MSQKGLPKLLLESLVVGILTAVVGLVIATSLMFFEKDFKLSDYHFWPRVMLGYFLTGFIIHLICEWTKINKWYCKNGNACLQ